MINYSLLRDKIKTKEGINISETELEELTRTIPREPIVAKAMAKYDFKEWQGESLGKLLSEYEVRSHFNLGPDDKAYLGYIDDKLVYFQYHAPFEGGIRKLNTENISGIMAGHKARLVENEVDAKIAIEVIKIVIERRV